MKIIKKCRISEKTLNTIYQYCGAEHGITKEDVDTVVRRSTYGTSNNTFCFEEKAENALLQAKFS